MKYQRDKFNNTPLVYALARNAHQCVGALLNHAIKADAIVSSMRMFEINELIIFSPGNLKEFFDSAITQIKSKVPKFGIVKSSFLLSTDAELDNAEIDKII